MNKSFIILLAVCLASVHALAKRDAKMPSDLEILGKEAKVLAEVIADVINPEHLKEQLEKMMETVMKVMEPLEPKPKKDNN